MGKPYADDLRLVVVHLIEEGHTRPEAPCCHPINRIGELMGGFRGYSGGVGLSDALRRSWRRAGAPGG
jgi:hypothetical protein